MVSYNLHRLSSLCSYVKFGVKNQNHVVPEADNLWSVQPPTGFPKAGLATMILLCCWRLWLRRHEVVFRAREPNLTQMLHDCKIEANLWRSRFPVQHRAAVDLWCSKFTM
ncbi:hypothetical protein U9M48_010178 [Paspalum notatum var. saurae]|uniref:Uncharacterized protein n=1 Tax=Paspalum notatum var. saurae TaxID=547442 RepID=A0AAQ3WFY6_PASNO